MIIPQIVRVLMIKDVGVTMPVECILDNNDLVLVKYWHNRFGPSVLINEWVCGLIAKELGLPIPDFGLCYLSKEVIIETNLFFKENKNRLFYMRLANGMGFNEGRLREEVVKAKELLTKEKIISYIHSVPGEWFTENEKWRKTMTIKVTKKI